MVEASRAITTMETAMIGLNQSMLDEEGFCGEGNSNEYNDCGASEGANALLPQLS